MNFSFWNGLFQVDNRFVNKVIKGTFGEVLETSYLVLNFSTVEV